MTVTQKLSTVQQGTRPRWFSANPSKAWGEKFFLIYSPIWMLQMAVVMLLHIDNTLGDLGYIIQSLLVALPLVLVPLVIRDETSLGRSWYQTYWFKANVYIFVFTFFGNYFGSEYFFDVLGMVYNYPNIHWTLDSALLGSGHQKVPLIMYILTQAYFMTYHSSAVVVLRRIRTSGIPGAVILFPLMVFAIGYFWAWMETTAMANPLMADKFYYRDMARMLQYGSISYACFFISSFPIFYSIDEHEGESWTLKNTIFAACAASMFTFYLLDFWTHLVGPL